MDSYRLSGDAESDIVNIYLYTIEKFGMAQADKYLSEMYERFSAIGAKLETGKPCDDVVQGLYRLRYISHVIYYRDDEPGAFILRVLHGHMDPGRHL